MSDAQPIAVTAATVNKDQRVSRTFMIFPLRAADREGRTTRANALSLISVISPRSRQVADSQRIDWSGSRLRDSLESR